MIDEVSGRGRAVAPRLPRVDTEAFAGPLAADVSVDVSLTVGAHNDQARAGADPEDTPGRARRTGGAHPSAGESTKWSTQSRTEGPGLLDWAVDQERATSRRHRLVSTLLSPQVDRAAPAGEWGAKSPAGVFPGVRPPAAVKGLTPPAVATHA